MTAPGPRSRLLTLATMLAAAGALAAPASLETAEPRAYGYRVGDTLQRRIVVHVPDGLTLDEATLPPPGRRGQAIELRSLRHDSRRDGDGRRHEITLTYQVFVAPTAVRTFEIAPFSLVLRGKPREQALRVEAWPVTVAPLVPVEVSPRRGLGEFQPDAPVPTIDTAAHRWRLATYGALALPLLLYLGAVYFVAPWWGRQRRPFALAWRQLRRLPDAGLPHTRTALRLLHQALNRTAGRVLLAGDVDAFIALQPRYAPLRDDLQHLFELSRRSFYADAGGSDGDHRWLLGFCRRCRDIERGSA